MRKIFTIALLLGAYCSNAQCPAGGNLLCIGRYPGVRLFPDTPSSTTSSLHCEGIILKDTNLLRVVDGVVMNKGEFLSPDSIANTVTLKGQEGMALFGPDGAYGALVITTKKYIREKTIMLKEVLVTNTYCSKICRYSTICGFSIPGDSLSAKQPSISRRANDPVYSNLPAVNIFPNPAAVDAPVTISFNGAATGEYQVSITNMSGQLVKQDVINISGKTFSYHIMPNAAMISGTCLINIINTTGKIIYSGQLVIQ